MHGYRRGDLLTGLAYPPSYRSVAEHGAVVWADIDRLGEVNHAHGHMLGDVVISAIADTIRLSSPYPTFRAAGDEFLITIPAEDAGLARIVAGRIERAVASADRLLERVADRLVPVGARAAHGQGYGDILAARRGVVDGVVRTSTVSVGAATAFEVGDSTLCALAEAAESAMNRARAERS